MTTGRFTPVRAEVSYDGTAWGWRCGCGSRDGGYATHARATQGLRQHTRRTGHGLSEAR